MGYINSCIIKPKNCSSVAFDLKLRGLQPEYEKVISTADVKDAVLSDKGKIYLLKDYDGDGFEKKMKEEGLDWIQCGDNVDLFEALSVVQDDSDYFQWFIYDSTDCSAESLRDRYWIICTDKSIENEMCYDLMYMNAHKATNEEIIEHFK